MESRDFCFWLQGFFELSENSGAITASQTTVISRHLDLVFAHESARLLERPAGKPEPPCPAPVRPSPQPAREEPSKPAEREVPEPVPAEPVRC